MIKTQKGISEKIDHLFRHEYGKLVSILTKSFGTSHIKIAEDAVQDAFVEALDTWSYNGVPENPVGWIYKVAKYKAVNIAKREKYKNAYLSEVVDQLKSEQSDTSLFEDLFTDQEIADNQLRMIFTCCHPSISPDSQVALTLKTLCGFSIPEIAKAFLTREENINKRLVRARKNIREAKIPFEVPTGSELNQHLSSVLESIYLLFNEGYNSTSGKQPIRYELCEEAIRLAEILASSPSVDSPNIYALLALMTLNVARFESRTDEFGNLLDLKNQDRSKWNQDLIKKGLYYLEFAAEHNEVSTYHILATISAQHCTTTSFELTDWESILSLYDMLLKIDPSPVVQLNRAIVVAQLTNAETALKQLYTLEKQQLFKNYLPYYTTKAELHFQNNEPKTATEVLNKALKLALGENQKRLINRKISSCSKKM